MNQFKTIACVAGQTPEAREAYARLEKCYGNADPAKADVIVALGGDGLMLQTLHKFMNSGKPIYGMHRGTIGFLMNEYSDEGLNERLTAAQITPALDASGLSVGQHAITPALTLPSGLTVLGFSPSQVPVTIVPIATPTPTP